MLRGVKKFLKRHAQVRKQNTRDIYGDVIPGQVSDINCAIIKDNKVVISRDGVEIISTTQVYTEEEISEEDTIIIDNKEYAIKAIKAYDDFNTGIASIYIACL